MPEQTMAAILFSDKLSVTEEEIRTLVEGVIKDLVPSLPDNLVKSVAEVHVNKFVNGESTNDSPNA